MRKIAYLFLVLIPFCLGLSTQIARGESGDTLGVESVDSVDSVEIVSVSEAKRVYRFSIHEQIFPSTLKLVKKCLDEAMEWDADYVVIDLSTYGGLVDVADSIRTRILNFPKPVYVYVNNQAISAGALIAISANAIYMRNGASIGAATVVDGEGSEAPDKYQSFMRAVMRSTAESHGKVVDRVERGDTVWRWFRDPKIAEAMVDPTVSIPEVKPDGKVLTFTVDEAIKWHFSEGTVGSVEELLSKEGVSVGEIKEYKATSMDRVLGFLTNPAFQAVLIMLIIGGIYFEIQSPGIGFASIVAVMATVLYFAPLYLEGLAAHWEIAVFLLGVVLIVLEIFVTPGFGVLGIGGIVAMVVGLTFGMIDSDLLKYVPSGQVSIGVVLRPFAMVVIFSTLALMLSIPLGRRLLTGRSKLQSRLVLNEKMDSDRGFVSIGVSDRGFVGRVAKAMTDLRPAGKVEIDGEGRYDATDINGKFIEKGELLIVVKDEMGVLYCDVINEQDDRLS